MPCEAQDKPVHGSGQKSAVVLRTQLTASEGGPYDGNTKKNPALYGRALSAVAKTEEMVFAERDVPCLPQEARSG